MATKAIAIGLLVTSLSMESFAQGPIAISGPGTFTCGDYLAHRQSDHQSFTAPQTSVNLAWVLGFISGYNYFSSDPKVDRIPGFNDVIAYLDNYCKNNPLSLVVNGASCLIGDSGGNRPPYCTK